MLELMRNKSQSLVIQVIIGLIAIVFIFWGVGSSRGERRNTVAWVNGEEISLLQYQQAYDRMVVGLRDQLGGSIPDSLMESLGLKKQVIGQLVQQILLRQGAREMGVVVADSELQDFIEKMGAFREKGVFSLSRYEEVLSRSRLAPKAFEESIRNDLLTDRVFAALGGFAQVSDGEARERAAFAGETVKLEYLRLDPAAFQAKVTVEEKALTAFFGAQKEKYKTAPQVRTQYLFFPMTAAVVGDDEVRALYEANPARFRQEEQRRARHILIRANDAEAGVVLRNKREQAEKIRQLAVAGKDFSQLAKSYSEDPGSAAKGGDLGLFGRGRMLREFDEAVFAMKPGETSRVIKTSFGFHVIRLEQVLPEKVVTLAEARDGIARELAVEKGKELSSRSVNAAYEKMMLAGSLARYAAQEKMTLQETGFLARDLPAAAGAADVVRTPAFIEAALVLKKGELSSVIETGAGHVIIQAVDRRESELPAFAAVRPRVLADFISNEAQRLALAEGVDILNGVRKQPADSGGLAKVAAARRLVLEESDFLSRRGKSPSALPPEVVERAFALDSAAPYPEKPVAAASAVYVFRLKDRRTPTPEELGGQAFRSRLREEKKQRLLAAWINFLEKRAKVEINKQFL